MTKSELKANLLSEYRQIDLAIHDGDYAIEIIDFLSDRLNQIVGELNAL